MRRAKGKREAEIYDIMIIPVLDEQYSEMKKIETSIIEKEIKRALIFSSSAKNAYECTKTLEKLSDSTNINLWGLISNIEDIGELNGTDKR